MIKIKLFDINQSVLFEAQGTSIDEVYTGEFKAGDYYRISTDDTPYIWVKVWFSFPTATLPMKFPLTEKEKQATLPALLQEKATPFV